MKNSRAVFITALIVVVIITAVSYIKISGRLPYFFVAKNNTVIKESSVLTPIVQYKSEEVRLKVPEKWRSAEFGAERKLSVPKGWSVSVFASGLPGASFFGISRPDGVLFLSLSKEGRVVALPDRDRNGVADRVVTVLSGLDYPHGLAWNGEWLYVAETTRIMRYRDLNKDYQPDLIQGVVTNLPAGGNHISRTIAFGPDDRLYVSVGSSCNVCVDDGRRAAILRYTKDGEKEEIYASGLRNSVGLAFNPESGELYATDNGRDFLGDNEPPDEVNIIKEGGNYGWPACFGDKRPDLDLKPGEGYCNGTEAPYAKLQAHSAPLGLAFIGGSGIPSDYKGSLLVAMHGSWNRSVPTGYKIARVRKAPTGELVTDDFASGWLQGSDAWGRPVDVIQDTDGAIYVSDDRAGAVYRFESLKVE